VRALHGMDAGEVESKSFTADLSGSARILSRLAAA